nr:uncharacterized protein LOC111426921 [Onthophagus taurus]
MNRYKQMLSTCSPLERVIKFNNAVTQGVTTLQVRLKSTPNNNNNNADQGPTTSSGICKHPPCKPAWKKSLEKCDKPPETSESPKSPETPIGCMPFKSNVPINPKLPKLPREPGKCRKSVCQKTC